MRLAYRYINAKAIREYYFIPTIKYNLINMRNKNLQAGLAEMARKMKRLLFDESLGDVLSQCKNISRRLIYYIKYLSFLTPSNEKFTNQLRQCIELAAQLLESSQFEKYGHSLHFFSHLIRKFNFSVGGVVEKGKGAYRSGILARMEKNQASPFYRLISSGQVQLSELHYLKSESIHELVSSLESKTMILPNPQCICCSQVIMMNSPLSNSNPLYSPLLAIDRLDITELEKLLNGIANQNGGVIIIGAKKTCNGIIGEGFKFQSECEMGQIYSQIQQTIIKVRPQCGYFVGVVPVVENFLLSKTLALKQHGVCFRVTIFPQQYNRVSYLQLANKKKQEYQEVYQLDSTGNPFQVNLEVYKLMHLRYCKNVQGRASYHQGIKCFVPVPVNISCLDVPAQNSCISQKIVVEELEKFKVYSDAPRFKYFRSSLLIVNSLLNEREIQNFSKFLQGKKYAVQLSKPFQNSFKQSPGDQCVWLLSHKMTHSELRKILKVEEAQENVKRVIKINPVEKTLQVKEKKFSIFNSNIFQKRFKERYSEEYFLQKIETVDKNKTPVKLISLTFADFEQSIYAFMLMEQLNLKPCFAKQGQAYEKM